MPWTIRSAHPDLVDPSSCDECHGEPPDTGNGTGQCSTCGTVLLCPDPGPNEVYRLTLILCDAERRPMPARQRRSIQIEWGERVQADGTVAKVYRLIDRQNDRYTEKITHHDGTVSERVEPLSRHRGHGSASARQAVPSQPRRRWGALGIPWESTS